MHTKNKIISAALAVVLSTAFFYTSGSGGCGASGAGDSGAPTGGIVTETQRQQSTLKIVQSLVGANPFSAPASLIMESEDLLNAETREVPGFCTSGRAFIDIGGASPVSSVSIVYENCNRGEYTLNGRASFVSVSTTQFTITYTNMEYRSTTCGNHTVSGTMNITETAPRLVTVVYNIATTNAGITGNVTGTMTINSTGTGVLNGNITSTNPAFTCNFVNTPNVCPAIAGACGLSSAELCSGDDFRDLPCSE